MSAVNFEAKHELSSPHLFILPKNDLLNSTVRRSKRDDVVLRIFFFFFSSIILDHHARELKKFRPHICSEFSLSFCLA